MAAFMQIADYIVSPFSGYVYPNETVLPWGVLIVIYPYITGLVAGAFIVSSLYHTFHMESFRPVARLALLSALAFLSFAPVALLSHLGHPERSLEAIWTAHWTSAFAAFGYVAGFYAILLILEIWFAFRVDIVAMSQTSKGVMRRIYGLLTLGSTDVSEPALAYDRQWTKVLAAVGIGAAAGLHGYVGFVFASLKSREWWSSDLMPIIFILSAVVSGVAVLVLVYVVSSKVRKAAIDENCMTGLARVLWAFLIVTIVVETLEYVEMFYRRIEGIEMIKQLVAGPISSGIAIQALFSLLPFVILTALLTRKVRGKALIACMSLSSVLLMCAVLPGAIEEVLRSRAVVHYLPRVVKQNMRFMDQDLEAGDLMLPMFAAANIDPEQFPHPDRFEIRRTPNRHLGFGFGIHLWLGATLARLEARVGLGQLIARFPRAQRDRSQPLELRQSAFVYSLKSYPIYLQG